MPLALLLSLLLFRPAHADAAGPLGPRCATVPQPAPPRQPPPPGDDLRDAYSVPNLETSDHFVLRWGNSSTPSSTDVDTILGVLEFAWGALVEDLEMPPPLGTDTHRFNVYLGDTGDGTPSSSGAAGYYTFDRQGWPMIVLSPYVTDDLTYGRSVIAHELFHALQSATGHYEYSNLSTASWFWEATAEWAAGEVYPDDPYYAQNLTAFAFYPHYPLDYFNYPDQGLFVETYQYGAFIFPRYLSEVLGRPDLVRDAWTDPGDADDPIAAIEAALAADGIALLPLVADFYAHNARWDYEDGDVYADIVDYYGGWFDDEDFQVAEWEDVEDDRDGDPQRVASDLRPGHLGASRISISARDACGTLVLTFDGDDRGTEDNSAEWAGVLALHHSASSHAYLPLEDAQPLTLDLDGALDRMDLVVVPAVGRRISGEQFGFTYAWTFTPAADRDAAGCVAASDGVVPGAGVGAGGGLTGPPDGCGCGRSTSTTGGLALLAPLLLHLRRRRSRRSGQAPSCST